MTMGSYLGGNPSIAYQGAISFLPEYMRRFLTSRYGDIYSQYEGELGRQAQQGLPTLTFDEYIQKIPWLQRYQGYSPFQRGENQSMYAPPARYLRY